MYGCIETPSKMHIPWNPVENLILLSWPCCVSKIKNVYLASRIEGSLTEKKKKKGHWGQKTNSEACAGEANWNKKNWFSIDRIKKKKKKVEVQCILLVKLIWKGSQQVSSPS